MLTGSPRKSGSHKQSLREPISTTLAALLNFSWKDTQKKSKSTTRGLLRVTLLNPTPPTQDSAALDLRGLGQRCPRT